jgi:hypothetical protein
VDPKVVKELAQDFADWVLDTELPNEQEDIPF